MVVIKIRDIIKYLVEIIIVVFTIICITRYFFVNKKELSLDISINSFTKKVLSFCIDETISSVSMEKDNYYEQENESKIYKILNMEIGKLKYKDSSFNEENENSIETPIAEEEIKEAETNITTEVVDNSGINTKFTNTYENVQIKNETDYELTEEMLTPNIELTNKKDIIIYHTHTCESYTSSEQYSYEPTGNFRTIDLNFSVARVGKELQNYLKNYGYNVIHNEDYHDYPAYTGSYTRSLNTISNILNDNKNTQIVFDLHRDAVGSNSSYAPTVKIGDEYAAQIMFVMGADGGGLSHQNWLQNLKFAIKIQKKANELYPGLLKPIILRKARYNQHVTNAASIIEVGATGNTLEQCLISMKYFSRILDEALK